MWFCTRINRPKVCTAPEKDFYVLQQMALFYTSTACDNWYYYSQRMPWCCKSCMIDKTALHSSVEWLKTCSCSCYSLVLSTYRFGYLPQGAPIHVTELQCNGTENHLLNCAFINDTGNCTPEEVVEMSCSEWLHDPHARYKTVTIPCTDMWGSSMHHILYYSCLGSCTYPLWHACNIHWMNLD